MDQRSCSRRRTRGVAWFQQQRGHICGWNSTCSCFNPVAAPRHRFRHRVLPVRTSGHAFPPIIGSTTERRAHAQVLRTQAQCPPGYREKQQNYSHVLYEPTSDDVYPTSPTNQTNNLLQVTGNTLIDCRAFGVKIMSSPQGEICGNEVAVLPAGETEETVGSQSCLTSNAHPTGELVICIF